MYSKLRAAAVANANAISIGSMNTASGFNSIALGLSNTAGGSNSIVLGSYGLTNALVSNGSFVFSATAGSSVFSAKGPRGFFVRAPGMFDLSSDGVGKYSLPASGLTAGFYFQFDEVVPNNVFSRHYVSGISYTRPQEQTGQQTAVGSISYHARAPSRWLSKFGQEPGNVSHALDLLVSDAPTNVENVGAGESLITTGGIKSFVAGQGITITTSDSGSEVIVTATGGTQTLSSETITDNPNCASLIVNGSGPNLAIKNISVGDGLSLTEDSENSQILLSLVAGTSGQQQTLESSGSLGESLVSVGSGSHLSTKNIVGGPGISLSSDETTVTITNTLQSQLSLTNAGLVGESLIAASQPQDESLRLKSLAKGDGITVSTDDFDCLIVSTNIISGSSNVHIDSENYVVRIAVDVPELTNAANIGSSLVSSGTNMALKSLVAGSGVSLTTNDTTVTISSSGSTGNPQGLAIPFNISPNGQQISDNNWTLVGAYLPFSAARAVSSSPIVHIVASLKVISTLDIRVLASDITPSSPLLATTALTTSSLTTYTFALSRIPAVDCLIELDARVGQGQSGSPGTKYGTVYACIVYL